MLKNGHQDRLVFWLNNKAEIAKIMNIKKIIFILLIVIAFSVSIYLEHITSPILPAADLNILLIQLDALRPDHLSCYGYKRNTSPNIDKLAKEAAIFTQAISQSCWTTASVGSMLTSTYEYTHGARIASSPLNCPNPTLAEILNKNGYVTGAIILSPLIACSLNFDRGFKDYSNLFVIGKDVKGPGTTAIADKAIEWLKGNKDKKFFLWLFYFDTHGPYLPPAPYDKLYLNDKFYKGERHIKLGNNSDHKQRPYGAIPPFQHKAVNLIGCKTDADYYIAQYDGEISFVDKEIGRLLDELNALELNKNTIVILTADHGESMGEDGYYFTHGSTLHDCVLKIPLIIKIPGINPKEKVIDSLACTMDIMPTILDALRIKNDGRMNGKSLLLLILGKKRCAHSYIISMFTGVDDKANSISIRTKERKLIYTVSKNKEEKYEFYDLKNDPEESNNLIEKEKLRKGIFYFLSFHFLKYKLDKYIKMAKTNVSMVREDILDKKMKEQLKSLGYAN